jgi:peptidoglycan-associated lipoprotein
MKSRLKLSISLLIIVVAASLTPASGQTSPAVEKSAAQPDLALTYTYIRSNAPPAGCGCFSLNGGSATFAWPISTGRFAIVGDITAATASNIANSDAGLTLSIFAGGVRYEPRLGRSTLRPFGELLVGVAHSSGPFVQGQYSATNNANAAFAANMGGGLDMHLSRRFSLRLLEADYLLTTFDNLSNNHQNNVKLSVGIIFAFGRK